MACVLLHLKTARGERALETCTEQNVLRAFSNPLEHLVTIGSSLLLPYQFKYIFKRRFFSEPL